VGAGWVIVGGPLWGLPTVLLAANAVSLAVTVRRYTGRWAIPRSRLRFSVGMAVLKNQRGLAGAWMNSAVYIHMPAFLVSMVTTNGLAVFAAADRLFRFAITGLGPLTQVLQGWVPKADSSTLTSRMRKAVGLHVGAGLAGGVAFPLIAPLAWQVLFGTGVPVSMTTLAIYGLALPVGMISRSLMLNVLAVSAKNRAIKRSATIGAVLAVGLIPLLAYVFGAVGAASGVVAAEVGVLIAQLPATYRVLSNGSGAP
jgi:hypothetical protein